MLKYILIAILFTASLLSPSKAFAQLSIQSPVASVIEVKPPTNSGLDCIYVVQSSAGLTVSYSAQSSLRPVWMIYDNRGGGFAEPIDDIEYSGTISNPIAPKVNCGYIIEDGSKRTYFWIVDYSQHALSLEGIEISDDSDCNTTAINIIGNVSPIKYYSLTGQPFELSRDMILSYQTLDYDDEIQGFKTVDVDKIITSSAGTIYTDSPLCATQFMLSGDRFLKHWDMEKNVECVFNNPRAVRVHTDAIQTERNNDNEQRTELSSGFGGSAPCEITFTAAVTDAAVFKEWQIASDSEFYLINYRDNSLEMNHTFRDEGTSYVRFAAANATGDCEAFGDVYEVSIGASDIKCPNAFSPGSSEGINDEWKVSYKSIVSFECSIFNRWGVKIISFNNPAQGWDGKYKGKLVGAGVYYYVIKAKGADGKTYNLSGDINIVGRNPNAINGSTGGIY